jgi:hypothetical protein
MFPSERKEHPRTLIVLIGLDSCYKKWEGEGADIWGKKRKRKWKETRKDELYNKRMRRRKKNRR